MSQPTTLLEFLQSPPDSLASWSGEVRVTRLAWVDKSHPVYAGDTGLPPVVAYFGDDSAPSALSCWHDAPGAAPVKTHAMYAEAWRRHAAGESLRARVSLVRTVSTAGAVDRVVSFEWA